MKNKRRDIIFQNKIFFWLAIVVGLILLFPFFANHRIEGWNWSPSDFVIAGILLFIAPSIFVLIARITPSKYGIFVAFGVLTAFLYIWVELAVGIFTNLGS